VTRDGVCVYVVHVLHQQCVEWRQVLHHVVSLVLLESMFSTTFSH
jgi:hypothetical protein